MKTLILGRYRHFKGNDYEVLQLARHSETREVLVVYRALYGNFGVWVRPLDNWLSPAKQDGQDVVRFRFIGK